MGKQHKKTIKRSRRKSYLKRKSEQVKATIALKGSSKSSDDKPATKAAPKKATKKIAAKKATKKTAAKKVAKKAAPKKAAE